MLKLFFLLLLLLSISSEDNNDGVYAQTSSDSISQEQVLYSNPEYYTLSEVDSTTIKPLQSVGLLFNIKSKLTSDDKTIYITGFEFYTQISGTVFYQLYSRQDDYYDTPDGASGGEGIGDWGKLNPNDLVSGGLAEGYGECSQESFENYINNEGTSSSRQSSLFRPSDGIKQSKGLDAHCPLTIIPQDAFPISNDTLPLSYPWTLKGVNSTRSFYLTLASTDLYVATSKDQFSSFDEVVVASTPHLELYEGVGSRTYPIDQNVSEYYLDQPVSFIGKIKYYVGVAGEELEEPEQSTPQIDLTLQPSAAPNTPVPTAKPTRRCRPTRPCPTPDQQTPTISPNKSKSEPTNSTIELLVYLENVPERTMSPREEEEYIEILQDFLQDNNNLIRNGVSTQKVEVFYHNVFEKDMINGKGKGNSNNEDEDSFIYHYNTKSTFRPQSLDYPTVYVMTKVDILTEELPYDVAAFFLWDELTKHEEGLVETFKTSSVFVTYFNDLTNITFEVVEDLTTPPTMAPTISAAPSSVNIEDDKSVERRNIYVFVGVFLGILWCVLTAFSFRTILKHRRTALDLQHANQVKEKSFSRRDSSSRRISMSASRRMRKLSIWAGTPVSQSSRGLGRETSMKSASGLSAVMEMEGASVGSEQVLDAEVQSDNQRVYYEDESGGDDTTTANDSGRTGRTGLSSNTKLSFGGRFLNEDTLL